MTYRTVRECRHCAESFTITNAAQVYCMTCYPGKTAYQRLKYYNLSQPEFEELLNKQLGLCALCDNLLKQGGSTNLNVDHCHVTGKVRGLVCHKCNMMLGFVDKGEWFNRLQRVTTYIANGYYV